VKTRNEYWAERKRLERAIADLDATWLADRRAMVLRIRKLVDKARSTQQLGNRAEAKAFFAKARDLCAKYGILPRHVGLARRRRRMYVRTRRHRRTSLKPAD